jgi:hypothetical protein
MEARVSEKETGGPAFPRVKIVRENSVDIDKGSPGMTLRDYFAAHCPDHWIEKNAPKTIGETRDYLIAKQIIPENRKTLSALDSYSIDETYMVHALLRYDYADAMLKARATGKEG